MAKKEPNIKLKEGATPITISGFSYGGDNPNPMAFPTEKRQKAGWFSKDAKRIVREYGDRYELVAGDGGK